MKVSIIIPVYNNEKHIGKCINSLIDQTYKNIEIIIINDGSTDNSLEICQKFAQNDDRIKVLCQANQGVSAARNKGIEIATGEYITFLDSDDSVEGKYLEELVLNNEEGILVRCNEEGIGNIIIDKEDYIRKIVSGKIKGVCWGYLFKKDLLNSIRFDTNTSYMEDTIFVVQYLLKVEKIKIIKSAVYNYLINQDSLTQNTINIAKRINGYVYSINRIIEILKENNNDYENILEKRKIKLLESDIAKVKNRMELEDIIENVNVEEFIKVKHVNFFYKIFLFLLKKKKIQMIMLYIKVRRNLKKLRGNRI